jgi:hypothetical protein
MRDGGAKTVLDFILVNFWFIVFEKGKEGAENGGGVILTYMF